MRTFACCLVMIVAACGGQTIGGIDAGGDSGADSSALDGGHCTTGVDCGGVNQLCGFLESDQCTALGHCFPSGPVCNTFSPGCSCAGTTINIACTGLPTGYAPAPLDHTGGCSTDGGVPDGGAYICGPKTCIVGSEICYLPNVPNGGTCFPSNGCTTCSCAQMQFQCVSTCKQSGGEIYVQCQ